MKPTYQIGLLAEWICLLRLWLTGWRVLARRWKHHQGEIDLIACRGRVIAFIEVKARMSTEQAVQAITHHQRQRIIQAAQAWMAGQTAHHHTEQEYRFDVMTVSRWPWPCRIPNAWQMAG